MDVLALYISTVKVDSANTPNLPIEMATFNKMIKAIRELKRSASKKQSQEDKSASSQPSQKIKKTIIVTMVEK